MGLIDNGRTVLCGIVLWREGDEDGNGVGRRVVWVVDCAIGIESRGLELRVCVGYGSGGCGY